MFWTQKHWQIWFGPGVKNEESSSSVLYNQTQRNIETKYFINSLLISMMPTMMMVTTLMFLTMMTGSSLGSSCLRNEDCASSCCSGYGWCVGPQSGDIQDILMTMRQHIWCRLDLLWSAAPSLRVGLMLSGDHIMPPPLSTHCDVRTLTAPPPWPGPGAAPPGAGALTTVLARDENTSRNLSPVFQNYVSRVS